MVNRAVFLDRDGVLNYLVDHDGQMTAPWSFEEFKFIPGAKAAVDTFKRLGYNVYVVTNQPDVYDGKLEENDLHLINTSIRQWLGINTIICCYERGSNFYKPNNGSCEMLIKKHNINRSESWLIGDRWKDIVCGWKSGLQTIYLGDHYITPDDLKGIQPNYITKDVMGAAEIIMEKHNGYQNFR